jgi:hypothetical protein
MKNLTILKSTLVSCVLATGCLSISSFATEAGSSQADTATQGNTLLHNLTKTFYGAATPPPTDDQNSTAESQTLKALSLNPSKDPLPAGTHMSALRQSLFNTQITGFEPPRSNDTTIIPDLFAQCALANIALPLGSNSARAAAAVKCYTTANNGVTPGSLDSKFTSIGTSCTAGSSCDNVRKAYRYRLYLNYCTTPPVSNSTSSGQPINIQAALQPCKPKTARQLYTEIGKWWKDQKTSLGLSKAQISATDDALKSSTDISSGAEDKAKSNLITLKGFFDSIVTAANSQYILSTLETLRQNSSPSDQQLLASSELESLLQLDRLLDQTGAQSNSNTCFSSSADKVGLKVAPLQSINNTMTLFAQRYPAPPKIYPMIPFQSAASDKTSLFVVAKPEGTIELLDLSKISADNKYWLDINNINQAQTSAEQRPAQRTLIEANQNTYRTMANTLSISRNAGFSNLLYLMNLRVPSAAFKSTSCASGAGGGAASPQEWMKASGLMRQNSDWTNAMKTATVGNALRQAVILLSEMRTQMYLDNQLQQRVLSTLTLLQLNTTKDASSAMAQSKANLDAEISKYVSGDFGSSSAATAIPDMKTQMPTTLPKP